MLQKRVDELEKKYNLSEKDAQNVKDAISSSKSDITIYPKGIWYRTAGNKVINALRAALKDRDVRDVLLEVTKKLLL